MHDIAWFGLYCQVSMKDIRENIFMYTFEENPQIYII